MDSSEVKRGRGAISKRTFRVSKRTVNIRLHSDDTLTCHTYPPFRWFSLYEWFRITPHHTQVQVSSAKSSRFLDFLSVFREVTYPILCKLVFLFSAFFYPFFQDIFLLFSRDFSLNLLIYTKTRDGTEPSESSWYQKPTPATITLYN